MQFSKRCLVANPAFPMLFGLLAKKTTVPCVDPLTVCQHLKGQAGQALSEHVLVLGRKLKKRPSADENEMCDSLPLRAPHHIKTGDSAGVLRPASYHGGLSLQLKFGSHVSNPRLASGFRNKLRQS